MNTIISEFTVLDLDFFLSEQAILDLCTPLIKLITGKQIVKITNYFYQTFGQNLSYPYSKAYLSCCLSCSWVVCYIVIFLPNFEQRTMWSLNVLQLVLLALHISREEKKEQNIMKEWKKKKAHVKLILTNHWLFCWIIENFS